MTAKRWSVALVSAAVLAGCGGDDGESCSVEEDADGNAVVSCPDGSEVVIRSGVDGTSGADGTDGSDGTDGTDGTDGAAGPAGPPGAACNTTDKVDGTVTVVCGDGPVGTLSDGSDGTDGTSCSVVDDPSSGKQIRCTDGTTVDLADGVDGASCSVTDNNDSTKTLSCTDGTVVTISDGRNGGSCSVAESGNGRFTMSCDDGSSVTWSAPRFACAARFDDAWASSASSLDDYYAPSHLTLSGGTLVGGASQSAPNSLGIDGTSGAAALRLDAGTHDLTFGILMRDVALDLIRADQDVTGVGVAALRGGVVVAEASVDLSVASHVATLRFEGIALDQVRITAGAIVGLDYIRFDGTRCPEP
jgi:hypothetical protein